MANFSVSLKIRAFDPFSKVTNKLRGALKQITEGQKKAAASFQMAGQINLASQSVGKFARVARTAVLGPIEEMIEFEQAMANVRAVSGNLADKEFKELTDKAREMGRTTKFAATDAAEGLKFLAIAGFSAEEQLTSIGPVLRLAQAGATDLGQASDIASDLLGAFRLEAKDMEDVADVLTATFTRSNTTLTSLFETMKLVGPEATDMGVSMRQVAGMTAVLGSAGIKGSMAGTALRQMFKKLVNPADSARTLMKKFGLEVSDSLGNLRKPTDILEDLIAKTEGLGTATRGKALSILFGARASTAVSNLLAKMKGDELRKFIDQLQDVSGETKRIAGVMDDTSKGALLGFQSAVSDLKIEFGSTFKEEFKDSIRIITDLVRSITKWFAAHPKLTAAIFLTVAAVAALLTALQGLLVIVATMFAAKGVLFLTGGFGGLARMIFGPVITSVQFLASNFMLLARGSIARLIPMLRTLMMGLRLYAVSAWAAVAPTWAMVAPYLPLAAAILAVVTAIAAVTLAIRQLVKVWDELDAMKEFKAMWKLTMDEGALETVKHLFDPTTLIESVKGDVASLIGGGEDVERIGAATGVAGTTTNAKVGGKIVVEVNGSGAPRVASIQAEGPVDLEVDAGLAMAGAF